MGGPASPSVGGPFHRRIGGPSLVLRVLDALLGGQRIVGMRVAAPKEDLLPESEKLEDECEDVSLHVGQQMREQLKAGNVRCAVFRRRISCSVCLFDRIDGCIALVFDFLGLVTHASTLAVAVRTAASQPLALISTRTSASSLLVHGLVNVAVILAWSSIGLAIRDAFGSVHPSLSSVIGTAWLASLVVVACGTATLSAWGTAVPVRSGIEQWPSLARSRVRTWPEVSLAKAIILNLLSRGSTSNCRIPALLSALVLIPAIFIWVSVRVKLLPLGCECVGIESTFLVGSDATSAARTLR